MTAKPTEPAVAPPPPSVVKRGQQPAVAARPPSVAKRRQQPAVAQRPPSVAKRRQRLEVETIKALANERRLDILAWLRDPRAHFPPQVDGDLVEDGVCGVFIAQKLGVGQPTASEHLRILAQAGLIRAKRIKQWTFYKRDERRIAAVKRQFRADW